MFTHAAMAGLMSVGVDVIDVGVVPTPTVQLAVEHHHAGAGLILTASHNPIEWNALKFVGPDGIFLDADAGARVRALADEGPPRMGWDGIGTVIEDRDAVGPAPRRGARAAADRCEAIRSKRASMSPSTACAAPAPPRSRRCWSGSDAG